MVSIMINSENFQFTFQWKWKYSPSPFCIWKGPWWGIGVESTVTSSMVSFWPQFLTAVIKFISLTEYGGTFTLYLRLISLVTDVNSMMYFRPRILHRSLKIFQLVNKTRCMYLHYEHYKYTDHKLSRFSSNFLFRKNQVK